MFVPRGGPHSPQHENLIGGQAQLKEIDHRHRFLPKAVSKSEAEAGACCAHAQFQMAGQGLCVAYKIVKVTGSRERGCVHRDTVDSATV